MELLRQLRLPDSKTIEQYDVLQHPTEKLKLETQAARQED
jgi:hypothetical protein